MMQTRFLSILCCPDTGECFHLDAAEKKSNGSIISGFLTTQSGRKYPIVNGIPRFASEEIYASSFGYEWKRWPRVQFEDENIGKPMEGHTTSMWEKITGVSENQVRDKNIVEFGCGSGRFMDVVRRKGGTAIGIELSRAVEIARQNFEKDRLPKHYIIR